ncbi:Negative elongation factor B [Chlorella sorokiniana]|uniref:Negative elongation factor B n=1 Tax=Chlorella sorokiniana TaxID=3076 RepID=A0A2P6U2Q6_CHLSO|nr:Negative elongation factor B [Chlorella sorokiniana]|eukprot:PRW60598.1 Negative elongation factor B [Chlorella sorokiniana]
MEDAPTEEQGPAPAKARRTRRVLQAERCQVTACTSPLLLPYHRKYHVCAEHFKVESLQMEAGGELVRFCQKCGRFQPLTDFDGTRKTCRVALEMHNARRRKRERNNAAAGRGRGSGGGGGRQRPRASGAHAAGSPACDPPSGGSGGEEATPSAASGSSSEAALPGLTPMNHLQPAQQQQQQQGGRPPPPPLAPDDLSQLWAKLQQAVPGAPQQAQQQATVQIAAGSSRQPAASAGLPHGVGSASPSVQALQALLGLQPQQSQQNAAMTPMGTLLTEAREALETASELSKLLDCGLDKEALSICIALLEQGVNPEALAEVVTRLRKQAAEGAQQHGAAGGGSGGGGDSGAPPAPVLVGNVGQEYVQNTLTTMDPLSAIQDIQNRGALQDPRCGPLIGLMDQLGLTRAESHRHVLQGASRELLARINNMQPDKLLQLLEVSFPYIGIADLRAIPLAVLDRLQPVPATFLKQLATDRELFWDLPVGVQRQVWELDKKLLQAHALPLVARYTYEVATAMRALDMDESLPPDLQPAPAGRPLPKVQTPGRKMLRSGSAALQRLTQMVGRSRQIYKGVVELIVTRYRDSDSLYVGMQEAALCALRSQLLMALHDLGETELCTKEACHKLAWTLDACLKDRKLDQRRLRELANFFQPYEAAARRSGGSGGARAAHRGGTRITIRLPSRGGIDDDAESAGAPGASHAEEPNQELADAGMVLRDPSTFHLILHHVIRRLEQATEQVIRRLEQATEQELLPKDDRELVFATRLLQLAVGCRAMLRDRVFHFEEASHEMLATFYPTLSAIMLDALLRQAEVAEAGPGAPQPEPDYGDQYVQQLAGLLPKDELMRKVTQVYLLERLATGDLVTGKLLLHAMAKAMEVMSDKSIPEFAPFGFTLALRVAQLLKSGACEVKDTLWQLAVDQVLVKLVDSETQAHEEVLRLLLAAAPRLDAMELSNYLTRTLNNSKKSRKRFKKRKLFESFEPEALPGYSSAGGYASAEPDYASAGYGGPRGGWGAARGAAQDTSADGVRATYALFAKAKTDLNPSIAPKLAGEAANPQLAAMGAGSGSSGPAGPSWSPGDVPCDAQEARVADTGAEKRKRRRFLTDGCQVEGCIVPLSLSYHRKYHICGDHFKAPCVSIDGQNLRFCQKCGRFQPLSEFQGIKRTCQRALDSHNARRRKREEAKRTASPSGGEGGSPPAQQQQRPQRDERQQRSGSGGSPGSASGRGGSPREAGGSSARARSGTTGGASLSHDTEQGAAAAGRAQQGAPSSAAAAAPAPAATPSVPSSLSQPQLLPAAPHLQPAQQQAQQAFAAWQQAAAEQAQAGWQQQSLGGMEHEPSSHQGQHDDSSMMVQHGSGSMLSGGAQTQPSSSMHPTGSGQTHPGSSPYTASMQLSGVAQHSSGFYPANAGLPATSNGFPQMQAAHQLPGWPAVTAAPALQPQAWGASQDAQLPMSLPMMHLGSNGAVAMPSLAMPQALPMAQPVPCTAGTASCVPMLANYAPAGVAAPMDELMGLPDRKPELKAEGLPPMSPLLGCLLEGADVGKWDPHSASGSGHFGGSPPQPQLGRMPAAPHSSPAAAVLAAAGMPLQTAAAVAAVAGEVYISPARLHRMSLKIFGCSPDQLGPGIRAELEAVLRESAGLIEASIRPGCTHITANLHMGHDGGNAPAATPAAEVLERLLTPKALGAAAGNPVLLQWQGQLAGTQGGGVPVGTMALPEPRLQVRPACVLAPLLGQPWPLVQLQLRSGSGGGSGAPGSVLEGGLAACLQQSSVLCRQAGRHLPVEVWGTTAAAAAAALSWVPSLREARSDGSGSGSEAGGSGTGSDSEPASTTSSRSVLLRDASIKSSDSEEEAADPAALPELAPAVAAAAAGSAEASPPAALRLWVRPVGLRPGCCEMEMQVQLPCGLPGAAPVEGPRAVLLSRPAPLLVMHDAAAAREIQALVRASGRTGAECFDDLLRDVGTAVAFLEQQQQPADEVESPIPPGFAAAAAHAAAECAHRRGMPALAALLQRALAAARAAVAAAAVDSQAAEEAVEEAGCSKAKLLAAEEEKPVKPRQSVVASKAGKAASDREGRALSLLGPSARFGTRSSAAVKAEAMLAERASGIGQPTSLPCEALLRLCALLAAIFAGVMAHRLALQGAAA